MLIDIGWSVAPAIDFINEHGEPDFRLFGAAGIPYQSTQITMLNGISLTALYAGLMMCAPMNKIEGGSNRKKIPVTVITFPSLTSAEPFSDARITQKILMTGRKKTSNNFKAC